MALSFSMVMAMVLPSSSRVTVSPSSVQVPVAVSRSSWFLQGLVSAVPSSLRKTSSICSVPPAVP